MDYKKEVVGSRVFVKQMRTYLVVNEANKDVFIRFGYYNLFEYEYAHTEKPIKHAVPNSKGAKRSKSGGKLSFPVHKRPERTGDTNADSTDVQQ